MRQNPRYSGPPIRLPTGLYWLGLGLAALSFCGSVAVHVFALRGISLFEAFPAAMALLPTTLASFAICLIGMAFGKEEPDTPRWAGLPMGALLINAIYTFFHLPAGTPTETAPGQYALLNRGDLVRVLTEQEYLAELATIPRAFSAFWMLFAGAALLGCAGFIRTRRRAAA